MKNINISLVLATLFATHSIADTNKDNSMRLEQITLATKTQKSIDGVAATVEVITQKEIEQMGAESLKDIMDRTPGLSVQYGTFPSASAKSKSSITIRGMSANGTLFLLDGRRLAGEVQNPYDLERIPASIVERIEIVKGPMSSLYGADAVGGVINIITKKPTNKMQIDAGVRYGMSEDSKGENLHLNLSLQGKEESFGYSVYSTYTTTKPYTQKESENVWVPEGAIRVKPSLHTYAVIKKLADRYSEDVTYREDSDIYTVGTRLSYDFSNFNMGLDINYFKEEREGDYIGYFHPSNYVMVGNKIPVFNIPVNSKDENERLDISIDATYAPIDELELKAKIYRSYYEKRNTTSAREYQAMGYANQSESAQNGMNANVDLQVAELSALYMPHEEHILTMGTEYREEKREASVFTQDNELTEKKVDYKSVYLQDEWQANDELQLIAGARYDAISSAKNKATFRLGGIYAFDDMAKLRANYAQGYRVADLREMYIYKQTPSGLEVGSEITGNKLEPESTNSYEIGLGGSSDDFRYDLVFFYNDIKNMIAQEMGNYDSRKAYIFKNIADAYTRGLELSLKYNLTNNLLGTFYYTELDTKNKQTKEKLEFQPERTAQIGLDYKIIPSLNLGLFAKYIGKQHFSDVVDRGASNEKSIKSKTDGLTLVDLRADYKLNNMLNLYGGINNIGNESVEDVIGSNMGRYYFLGARMHF